MSAIATALVSMLIFVVTSALALLLFVFLTRGSRQAKARVRDLGGASPARPAPRVSLGALALSKLPDVGGALLPREEGQRNRLAQRFIQAGLYDPQALSLFLTAKLLLLALGVTAGLAPALMGLVAPVRGVSCVVIGGSIGVLLPGLWLDAKRKKRQASLRRALPDVLDMMVLCVEGGVSLNSAIQRVNAELETAHPVLGAELKIVQREMLLGLSTGEALQKFGQRADLEEVRSLAAVLLQNERYGASVTRALRIHADTLRQQRQQRAEEQAQKAAVKILFPTLLCIFPAIFIVILGPAAFQIMAIFSKMK